MRGAGERSGAGTYREDEHGRRPPVQHPVLRLRELRTGEHGGAHRALEDREGAEPADDVGVCGRRENLRRRGRCARGVLDVGLWDAE